MPDSLNHVEFPLADFDRGQLPEEERTLRGESFRKAVQRNLEEEYARLGGAIEIVVTEAQVSVRWKKGDQKSDFFASAIDCLKAGDLKLGVAMLRLARKTRRNDFGILFNLGMALSDLGELPEAIAALNEATRLEADNPHAWTALGVALARQRQPQEARLALEKAVRIAPADPHALKNLGGLLLRTPGDERRALDYLSRSAVFMPNDASVWFGCGRAHEVLGELAAADTAYQKVIELSPSGPMADDAKAGRVRIAEANFRVGAGKKLRMDAVMYCAGALKTFSSMGPKDIERVAVEIAILGTRGLDVNDPAKQYEIRALPGKFSGLHLLCIEYVGFKLVRPEIDLQFDLSAEFDAARQMG
jgi:Flp pilus assembly protein TadD